MMSTTKPSSIAVYQKVLVWSAALAAAVAVIGSLVAGLMVGMNGVWSALVAAGIGFGFAGVTVLILIVAVQLDTIYFFATILFGWLLKFVLFMVVLWIVRDQPWIHPVVLWACLVAALVGTLAVDVVCVMRARLPYVSDSARDQQ